jgi:hypothetical protein
LHFRKSHGVLKCPRWWGRRLRWDSIWIITDLSTKKCHLRYELNRTMNVPWQCQHWGRWMREECNQCFRIVSRVSPKVPEWFVRPE